MSSGSAAASPQRQASGPSTTAMVVTPHTLATNAAVEILRRGGNAVDGAIAANAVQGVVAPETCGIGGDLFALVHASGEPEPLTLNASGKAGSGVTAAQLRAQFGEMPTRHPATVTVPGCVDGWEELSERLGRLPLAVVLEPAIRLAERGFPASVELALAAANLESLLAGQPSARPLYPDGAPMTAGEHVVRPGLAATLRAIAEGGRGRFYEGPVADAIVAATDGILTRSDLEPRHTEWVRPLSIDVFGATGWTTPPNTQGYIALAAAWIFEQLDAPTDPRDPLFHHCAVEAYRSIAWERNDIVSDAATSLVPPESLLDDHRLATYLRTIDRSQAGVYPAPDPAPGGTAYLCVRDANGMGVSLIQSNFWGIGSGRSAGNTGVFLHNRGAGFNLTPGHPNEYAPGKRPLHTLSPTLWTVNGRLTMLLGTRGGQFQPQLLLQMVAAVRHAKSAPHVAQDLPRWQVTGWERGGKPELRLEDRFDDGIADELARRGHSVSRVRSHEPGWGPVSVIIADDETVTGAADPRITTASVGLLDQ